MAGSQLQLSACLGVALCPDRAQSAEELLMQADAAMYRAKVGGEGGVILYQP
ncbi:diguanylate cyclase domain-containing protein [Desulfuromonas thiophila]|uniref:diguanylate cyclase domain-containing protein n=1 Tax=Desulfuromonas thiophila TaxID=57664 RepID=UPI00389948FD